ncbi:MAG: 3-hydroxybutyryl-CoA dehydrogenase, partial [Cyclobacteriaceae bacterium]|nr:3-hydroxybutyryl-CoA dehydrogenase [Cyclobacteriaceae bacterium]
MTIKNITIIGTGNLGSRIGLQAAISGYTVIFYDISDSILSNARTSIEKISAQLIKASLITETEKSGAIDRITYTTDLQKSLADCDLISESVTEDLVIKEKVWKRLGELAPSKTIFTTNTSYLLPSQLATISGRPEKFCAFHFHDVFYARVV